MDARPGQPVVHPLHIDVGEPHRYAKLLRKIEHAGVPSQEWWELRKAHSGRFQRIGSRGEVNRLAEWRRQRRPTVDFAQHDLT